MANIGGYRGWHLCAEETGRTVNSISVKAWIYADSGYSCAWGARTMTVTCWGTTKTASINAMNNNGATSSNVVYFTFDKLSSNTNYNVSFSYDVRATLSGVYQGAWSGSLDISTNPATYSVTYNANGGSGAPGDQTKTQGVNLTLSSTKPTRSGYEFVNWNTISNGTGTSYNAGATYTGDAALALYAQWKSTYPSFSAPSLSRTETTLSWAAFTVDISSNISYKLDSGSWVSIGTNTKTASGGSVTVSPNTKHTITFRAYNSENTSFYTDKTSEQTSYDYPYISALGLPSADVGSNQIFTLYNPLSRPVTIKIDSVNGSTGTFANTTTNTTSASITIPIDTVAAKMTNKSSAAIVYSCTYGSVSPKTFNGTVNIPASIGAPSIDTTKATSFFSYADVATFTMNDTSYTMDKFTGSSVKLLQAKSKLRYSLISANNPFTAKYGASLSSYSVKLNSKSATATTLGTTYYEGLSSGVTSLSNAVTVTENSPYVITIAVTDTRGFTSSYTLNLTTYAYSSPSPNLAEVSRIDGYGEKVKVVISGTWSPNMNGVHTAKSIILQYKLSTASSYTSYTLYNNTGSATSYKALSGTYTLNSLSFESDKVYNFRITATDGLGTSITSKAVDLPLGTPILFVDAATVGVGINRFPKGKGLYAIDADFTNATIENLKGTTKVNCLQGDKGGNWISSRDNAIVKNIHHGQTAGSSYNPVVSIKTTNGEWSIGNLSGNESLYFSYTTDSNYSSKTNTSVIYTLGTDGRISSIPKITKGTGNPSGGQDGDVYLKYEA